MVDLAVILTALFVTAVAIAVILGRLNGTII
mgnify:FL=1|jgi:hypothetical protein